jgi:hypothetical protein
MMQNPLGFNGRKRVHVAIATSHPEEQTMTSTPRQTTEIPASENETFGFWGTMGQHASDAWPLAMTRIAEATGADLEAVRTFLDGRHGRHFADSVQDQRYGGKALDAALDAAIDQWMGWTIGRETSKDYGIPRGLPYLTGFVINEGLMADDDAA